MCYELIFIVIEVCDDDDVINEIDLLNQHEANYRVISPKSYRIKKYHFDVEPLLSSSYFMLNLPKTL